MIDYQVVLLSMPSRVHESVVKNEDDTYTIFLNKNETYESMKRRFDHAMRHILNSDFEHTNVQEIERRCHDD
jgi:hypothetical protein